ncbi:MAG: autotransporter-associated beta strand repeat-containing protein [Verrucomicrobiota bacterium]
MKPRFLSPSSTTTLTKSFHPAAAFFAGVLAFTATGPLEAASDTWDNGAADNNWQSVNNWVLNATFPGLNTNVYTSTEDATFSATGATGTVNLGNQINLRSLIFGVAAGNAASFTLGDANDVLNLTTAGGVTVNAGVTTAQNIGSAGTTINLSNASAASATFTNNSTNLLTVAGNVVANGAGTGATIALSPLLTVTGSGNTTISGTVSKVTHNALLKTGAGTLTLTNGSSFSGAGAIGYVPATAAGFPLVVREGTLLLNGGTHASTGEIVIGGVVANGGAGQNAKIQVDSGSMTVSSWLSVGRGNGVGGVSSDLALNNGATVTSANYSGGFNGGNAANLVKGSITLNGTSMMTVTGNDGNFNHGESTGSNLTLTLNNTATLVHNGGASGTKIGLSGRGILNNASVGSTVDVRNLIIGQAANGIGAVYNKGTLKTVNDGYFLGDGSGSSSYLRNDNALATVANDNAGNLAVGIGLNSNAVTDVISGSLSATRILLGAFNSNASNGQINVTGGTLSSGATGTSITDSAARQNKWGNINVTGAGVFANPTTINLSSSPFANNTGILSIASGGTVTADTIITNGALPNAYVNFDSGTLRASSGTSAALIDTNIDRVTVYGGGGTIDTNSFNKNIDRIIAAPTGNGVTSVAISATGTGYLGRPLVKITGDGTGATAMADFNLATGEVTGITVTSPGAGYTTATVTVTGGGGTAITATPTLSAPTAGGITKASAGTLTLSAANTYTGPTLVNGGKLSVTGSLASSSAVTVANGATLGGTGTVNGTTTVSTGGIVEGGVNATGKLNLSGLAFNGAASVKIGTLSNYAASTAIGAGALSTAGGAGAVVINIASLGAATAPSTYTLIDYTGGSIGGTGFSGFSLAALPSRALGSLVDTGSQINLSLTSLDFLKWTGNSGSSWDTTTSSWKLNSNNNATLYINSPGDSVVFDDSAVPNFTVDISTADVSPTSVTFNNTLTNIYSLEGTNAITGVTSLTKNNTGILSISNPNTYSGGTILNGGTLNINNNSAIGTGTLTINGGELDSTFGGIVLGTNNPQVWNADFNFVGTGALNLGTGAVTLSANRILDINGDAPLTVGGVIGGPGFSLTKEGPQALILGGANTYTGGTTVNEGILQLNQTTGAANIGTINVNGGSLVFNPPGNNFGYAPAINLTVDTTFSKIGNPQINYTGTLTGTGNDLEVNTSAGRFYMNATVSGIDQINITGGAMGFDLNVGNRAGGAPVNVSDGASLWMANGTNTVANNITLNGGTGQGGTGALFQEGNSVQTISGAITLAAGNSLIGGNSNNGITSSVTISGAVGGPGSLTKAGTHKLVLSGANTYPGSTTVNAGTLAAGIASVPNVSGAFGNNSAVALADVATAILDITGFNTQIGSITGGGAVGGNVTLGAATLTTGADDSSPAAYAGAISGTGALVKIGNGTQTLSGASSYTGDTTIHAGFLAANRTNNNLNPVVSALGNPQVARNITVNSGGTLGFILGDTLGGATSVVVSTLVINAGGLVTNNADNFTNLGPVLMNGGVLTTAGGAVGGYQSYYFSGDVSVGGSTASAITVTAGGNAFNGFHLGTNTTFTVADATGSAASDLDVTAPLINRNQSLGGNGGLTKAGSGTMTLGEINTYTGNTVVSAGTLVLDTAGQLKFVVTTNGLNNSLSGAGAATLKGGFNIDHSGADIANGNSWTLVDVTSKTYDSLSFNIPGFTQAADVWTKVEGNNTWRFHETGVNAGKLTLEVATPSGYATWASTNAPTGTADDDFDNDGVANGVEYVLGGLATTNDNGKLPGLALNGGDLVFTFMRDQNSETPDTTAKIEVGTSLSAWPASYAIPNNPVAANPGVTVVDNGNGTDSITLRIPQAPDTKKFARLVVTIQ